MKKFLKKNYLPLYFPFILTISTIQVLATDAYTQDAGEVAKQKIFEKVFGDAVILDSAIIQKVITDKPGNRHYVDKNNDGKPDEVWFTDIDPRHNDKNRPLLVRVIDENGNLEMNKEPDKYGDLWIADYNADGVVDAVIGYEDIDGDHDVDQMGMYFYDENYGLRVWWIIDEGDDNLLWYDVDYKYDQLLCQNKTHFGGNETFYSFYYSPGRNRWIPFWENPFLFFDDDNNGITEETIRIEGEEYLVKYLRWSFNVDPTNEKQRDFDISISACAPGWSEQKDKESDFTLYLDKNLTDFIKIRDISAGPVIKRVEVRSFLQSVTWSRVLLTWDENDLNIAFNDPSDISERWEGVIAAPGTLPGYYMPQIGGPDCGPFNKRYELVLCPEAANEFYFNPADNRLHIKNSDKTWIKVDYNGDLSMDMYYEWIDINCDGIMDRINIDVNGDGNIDDFWNINISGVKPVNWKFNDLNSIFESVIEFEPESKYLLVKNLTAALESVKTGEGHEPVWDMIEKSLRGGNFTDEIASRLIESDETLLYYLTLVQDRHIAKLKNNKYGSESFWQVFNTARSQGNMEAMLQALIQEFNLNSSFEDYEEWIGRLRKGASKQRVAWSNQWLPPNWGWESEKAAFRFYNGHFDLFGKRVDTLIFPKILKGENYHVDSNTWGMDILHVGNTSGCGGVTLYVNDVAYPVRNEGNTSHPTFTCRLVEENPDTVVLEFLAEGVGPEKAPYTVRLRPSIFAGRFESPVEVMVTGGLPGEKVELGIGLTRLSNETFFSDTIAGIIGTWGFQEPEIGWMGMGIIFPPERFLRIDDLQKEHKVVLRCEPGNPITYYIRGDWLRGRQFSCCPTARDWMETLKEMAKGIFVK